MMRNRQIGVIAVAVLLIFCLWSILQTTADQTRLPSKILVGSGNAEKSSSSSPSGDKKEVNDSSSSNTSSDKSQEDTATSDANNVTATMPVVVFDDKPFPTTKPKPAPHGQHPIVHLVTTAEKELEALRARQSKTLEEAVAEYRRRYGIPPPPNFDKWWKFAQSKNVQLIDEFDMIHEMLTPFWGMKPATIRARVREILGYKDNQLIGVQIRGGNMSLVQGGFNWNQWLHPALRGMTQDFVQYLPDMDIAFNINDEPRVVVQHEDLARLVETARNVAMPAANKTATLRNAFTEHPDDLNYDDRFEEVKTTRFNTFSHQPVWVHSRMSCSPDSPARIIDETAQYDDEEKFLLGELGFVSNWTAMSDICLSPSLRTRYGFFERPNSYTTAYDLVPIFSQSKISSYADILYPSPWYWVDKVPYNEEKDLAWTDKRDALYWRGSTTGGFSRAGGWRRQHRQRVVRKINAHDNAFILAESKPGEWKTKEVPRQDYAQLMDVYFSHIGQCDPSDCDAQKAFFDVKEYAKQEEAFKYKHVLDMDGNAFSGRFYALMRSRSLVYKWAIFREWHAEWLKPWAHFVPMSLRGDEWLELVRFFGSGESEEGLRMAEKIAMQGREWAEKVVRKEDMEVWFFRLLLEYGRVIDDNRETIGYAG